MSLIKLYGERNTGTNYLSELIDLNFQVDQLRGTIPNTVLWKLTEFQKDLYFSLNTSQNLGWKHASVPVDLIRQHKDKDQVKFICLIKNPYSFLLSLYKRPYHYKGKPAEQLEDFLSDAWTLRKRDLVSRKQLSSPTELWNLKVQSYFTLQEQFPSQTLLLKYEDLVVEPIVALNKIAKLIDTSPISTFKNKESSTKKEKKSYQDYKLYYQEEKWRSKFKQKHINLINQDLDRKLTERLGYEFITSL